MGRQNLSDDDIFSSAGNNQRPDPDIYKQGHQAIDDPKYWPKPENWNWFWNMLTNNMQYVLRYGGLPWDEEETYPVGVRVYENDKTYLSLQESTGKTPANNSDFWKYIEETKNPSSATSLGTTNLNSINTWDKCGFYYQTYDSNTEGNNYPVNVSGSLIVMRTTTDKSVVQIYTVYNSGVIYVRTGGTLWSEWKSLYDSGSNKPTADDVGARPDDWMPTADDVGARPDDWMPTADDVGARPDDWMPTAKDVGSFIPNLGHVIAQDWNDLNEPGTYDVSGASGLNRPPGAYTYGSLFVQSSGVTLTQIYVVDSSTGQMFFRFKYSTNSWRPWARVYSDLNPPKMSEIVDLEHVGKVVVANGAEQGTADSGGFRTALWSIVKDPFSLLTYNNATGEFTVKYTGFYELEFTVHRFFDGGTGYETQEGKILIDGSTSASNEITSRSYDAVPITVRDVLKINAGQKIQYTTKRSTLEKGSNCSIRFLRPSQAYKVTKDIKKSMTKGHR